MQLITRTPQVQIVCKKLNLLSSHPVGEAKPTVSVLCWRSADEVFVFCVSHNQRRMSSDANNKSNTMAHTQALTLCPCPPPKPLQVLAVVNVEFPVSRVSFSSTDDLLAVAVGADSICLYRLGPDGNGITMTPCAPAVSSTESTSASAPLGHQTVCYLRTGVCCHVFYRCPQIFSCLHRMYPQKRDHITGHIFSTRQRDPCTLCPLTVHAWVILHPQTSGQCLT